MKNIAAILSLSSASPAALAALNIFACTPEWGALAKELGGDKANVYVAATALQDPHRIEARPSLIARARNADLMVCNGAQLEIGWLPLVQQQSGNTKVKCTCTRPPTLRIPTTRSIPRRVRSGSIADAHDDAAHRAPRREIGKRGGYFVERNASRDGRPIAPAGE